MTPSLMKNVNNAGRGNALNLYDTSTLVFDITEAKSKLRGFNLIPGVGATRHSMKLTVQPGTPIFYGPFKDRVWSNDINLEPGIARSLLP